MMQDRLAEALKEHGVDYADIRLEDQTSAEVQAAVAEGRACPAVSPALEAVFAKMVAKAPETRYQTITAVIGDLEQCLAGDAVSPPAVEKGSASRRVPRRMTSRKLVRTRAAGCILSIRVRSVMVRSPAP